MEYTPPPTYNSIDVESSAKSSPAGQTKPLAYSCALWLITNVIAGLSIHYYKSGSPITLAITIITLLMIFYIVYRIGSAPKESTRWNWSCITYLPALQLFLFMLVFFSNKGLNRWLTVSVYSGGLMSVILGYCFMQGVENWDADTLWEQHNGHKIYTAPLLVIAGLHLTDLLPGTWINMAYFVYFSVVLALTTKHIYTNTDNERILPYNMRINAITGLMFLALSSI
ncbi:HBL289Cp [Eremothecium sinecaudum]|uniref:HBL289Cp n=1 Tax=Eremothecium sinecaudum TaxID=45286 RepID=A0A109UW27_9SACH|nr:HBL289Cp [Eremothecium sinecaudum]AMD18613.1 HBL289Cp [Eremothecium sinecaudum]